jgi:hypothetical protein
MREAVDTVEPGLGGGRCGEAWRSGYPFAGKNFGWARWSPMLDPTADADELWGAGIDSPLA